MIGGSVGHSRIAAAGRLRGVQRSPTVGTMSETSRVRPSLLRIGTPVWLGLLVPGCLELPGDGRDDPSPNPPPETTPDDPPYWVLYEDDGSPSLPERARGTTATVSDGGTRIDFTGAAPEGWSVQMISTAGFPPPGDSTDATLTATLERPTATCTITPDSQDADNHALSNLVFLEGEPAGQMTFVTTCPGFDEPDEPVDVPRAWTVSFAPPSG